MPTLRRNASSTVQATKVGNDVGSKEKGLGVKRTGSGLSTAQQAPLSFAAKKGLGKSPSKKKQPSRFPTPEEPLPVTKPIDLTLSSPAKPLENKSKKEEDAPEKKFASVFSKPEQKKKGLNPFLDEEDDEQDQKKPHVEMVKRDEFGFVSTVPENYAPLGEGKETKQMIENLVGPSVTDKSEGSELPDLSNDDSNSTTTSVPQGLRVRKSMIKASEDLARAVEPVKTDISGKSKTIKGSKENKLEPKDKKWDGIWKDTKQKMGTETDLIHCTPKTHNRVNHILRVFDLSSEYGPCVGLTRLERWNRAEIWGLEPPSEVRDILLTDTAAKEVGYRETVFHDRGIYVP